jgi:DNA polymerase-3 subunit gamma/tau
MGQVNGHLTLYRKWRPGTFEEVVGQERVTRTLQNAIAQGRIVHAYLFSGHRGTGKTTTARILAKALNCVRGPTPHPCGECVQCRTITEGTSLDVIELDAASNRGIDEIREIRERVRLLPAQGRYKVYILDEAHMLTDQAENALLKTLEEPPPHAVFVLVTTEPHRLPATILSRCQRFEFRRVPTSLIVQRLRMLAEREGIRVEDAALHLIARSADGALRDAEAILDQLMAFTGGHITGEDVVRLLGTLEEDLVDRVVAALRAQDVSATLRIAAEVAESGRDVRQVLRRLLEHFRDLLVVRVAPDARALVEAGEERYRAMQQQAADFSEEELLRAITVLSAAEAEARWTTQPRLALELALLRLARPEVEPGLEGLRARVARLERILQADSGRPAREEALPAPVPDPKPDHPPEPPLREEGGVSLDRVASRWEEILERIRRRRAYTHALLSDARPVALEGSGLVVEVTTGGSFAATTLGDPRHRSLVEEVIRKVLGVALRVRFVAPPREDSPPEQDPLVQQATHLLGPLVEFRPFGPSNPAEEGSRVEHEQGGQAGPKGPEGDRPGSGRARPRSGGGE